MWNQEEAKRQDALIEKAGLPTQLPKELDIDAIVDTLQTDKKVKDGKVRFVLPTQIGAVTITDQVPADVIRQVLRQMQAWAIADYRLRFLKCSHVPPLLRRVRGVKNVPLLAYKYSYAVTTMEIELGQTVYQP